MNDASGMSGPGSQHTKAEIIPVKRSTLTAGDNLMTESFLIIGLAGTS